MAQHFRPLIYERVHLQPYKVADTPFPILVLLWGLRILIHMLSQDIKANKEGLVISLAFLKLY